jgi:hypothetical protein
MVVPLLPFDALNSYALGEFTLRLAVLMYSCEFIIGKSTGNTLLPVNGAAILSMLLAIALRGAAFF